MFAFHKKFSSKKAAIVFLMILSLCMQLFLQVAGISADNTNAKEFKNFITKVSITDGNGDPFDESKPIGKNSSVKIKYSFSIPEEVAKQINDGDVYTMDMPDVIKVEEAISTDLPVDSEDEESSGQTTLNASAVARAPRNTNISEILKASEVKSASETKKIQPEENSTVSEETAKIQPEAKSEENSTEINSTQKIEVRQKDSVLGKEESADNSNVNIEESKEKNNTDKETSAQVKTDNVNKKVSEAKAPEETAASDNNKTTSDSSIDTSKGQTNTNPAENPQKDNTTQNPDKIVNEVPNNSSDKNNTNNTDNSNPTINDNQQNVPVTDNTKKTDSSLVEDSPVEEISTDSIETYNDAAPEVSDSQEKNLGTVTFNTDNTITIVFTGYAKEHYENVHGSFSLTSYFDSDKISGSGDKEIKFTVNGQSETVIINFKGEDPTISKEGSYESGSKEITWTIIVDTKGNPAKGLSISDTIVGPHTFKEDGLVDSEGNTGNCLVDKVAANGDYDSTSKTFKYNIPDGFNGVKYIKFKTIPDKNITSNQGNTKIENTAELLNENKEKIDDSSTNVNINVSRISKSGQLLKDKKSIEWTIIINDTKDTLKKPTIIDNISKDLELVKDTVELKKDGKEAKKLEIYKDYTLDANNQFKYIFNEDEITTSYTLTFRTTIKNYSASGDSSKISNVASLETGNDVYLGKSGDIGIPKGISKKGSYNATTGLLEWTITVNPNEASMKEPVITDDIVGQQDFVEGSVTVCDASNPPVKYENYTFDYAKATPEQSNAKKGTLSIKFNEEINKTYIIKFNTKPDISAYERKVGDMPTFNNSCSLKIGDNTAVSCDSKPVRVDLRSFDKRTDGGYDEATNEIGWNIVINEYNIPLKGVVSVKEAISNDQEFVKGDEGSLLGKVTLLKNGDVVDASSQLDCKEEGKNIIFTFKNTNSGSETRDKYEIKLKTKIIDFSRFANVAEYRNEAYLFLDNVEKLYDYEDVSVPKKSFVTKSAENYNKGDSFINWKVKIDLAGVQKDTIIDNASINDTLEEGLALASMDNPIEFIECDSSEKTINSWNLYEFAGNENPYNNAERKLSLVLPQINTSKVYLLKFRTDITDKTKDSVSNSVSFSGTGYEAKASSDTVKLKYQSADGSGSGELRLGSINITKMDAKDHNVKLSGAEFKLYKADDLDNSIATQKSDPNGEVYFNNIKKGSYVIKEVTAPEGYLVDKEESDVIDINGNKESLEWYNSKITPKSIKIIKTKKNNPNILLEGAEFRLSKADGGFIDSQKTKADGTAIFPDLPNGIYTVEESRAPSGYRRNYDEKTVTITDTSEDVQEVTFENEKTSSSHHHDNDDDDNKIKGSIKVTKIDENNNALKGAEFSLYDLKGVLVQSEFSNDEGIAEFKDLPIGSYTVKETKGISGYKMDVMPRTVTLSSSKQKSLTIKNEKDDGKEPVNPIIVPSKDTGCIKVTKINTNKEVLSGAQIGLYNAVGQAICSKTTGSEGIVVFDNIPAGKYTIKEVKAPKGYTLSNEKIEVSLGSSEIKNYSITDKKDAETAPSSNSTSSSPSKTPSKIANAVKSAVITTPSNAIRNAKNKITSRLPQSGSFLDTKVLAAIGLLIICVGLAFYIKKKCKGWK